MLMVDRGWKAQLQVAVTGSKMWRRASLWLTATVVFAAALDSRSITRKRSYLPPPQMNCVDYKLPVSAKLGPGAMYKGGLRPPRFVAGSMSLGPAATRVFGPVLSLHDISRRFDSLLPDGDDLVKEHAKLVADINSLRQAVFVAPIADETRDYDDTIFHEIIETAPTTTARPTTTRAPPRPTRSSFPVLLLGGAGSRPPARAPPPPLRLPRPTISLVGTSVSPVAKHPYPFASASTMSRQPVKICVTSMPTIATTRRPSLWERIISSIIPR